MNKYYVPVKSSFIIEAADLDEAMTTAADAVCDIAGERWSASEERDTILANLETAEGIEEISDDEQLPETIAD